MEGAGALNLSSRIILLALAKRTTLLKDLGWRINQLN
jgi:hypothetical protein